MPSVHLHLVCSILLLKITGVFMHDCRCSSDVAVVDIALMLQLQI